MKKILILAAALLVCFCGYAQDAPGLYAMQADGPEQIEAIKYGKIKAGGLASALTFGVAKSKARYIFNGSTSAHAFQGSAALRIVFGSISPLEMSASNYMFTPAYSVKDFAVIQFKAKGNKREITAFEWSIAGATAGVSEAEGVRIEVAEIRNGVYDLKITGEPGEYGVVFNGSTPGGFGAAAGVFDFTIK